MSTSTEKQVYQAFSDAVNSGDLAGAFQNATEDITFRPIGSHPDFGREFTGMQDILENCWMKIFQHIDENGVAITVSDIVAADGIAIAHLFAGYFFCYQYFVIFTDFNGGDAYTSPA